MCGQSKEIGCLKRYPNGRHGHVAGWDGIVAEADDSNAHAFDVLPLTSAAGLEVGIEAQGIFLDGIDDSLKQSNNLDDVTEDSEVTIDIDTEKLYMNMVGCNAEWLYTLPEWDAIYDKETRDALYKKEKTSHTVVKAPKVGRNDPCPCGSGKKFKKCCGK